MYPIIKYICDLLVALIILIVVSPILILTTLFLFVSNQGKPFFIQPRPGLNGRVFNIVKFKTMNDKRNSNGDLLPDEIRLTKVGQVVRKLSLDELPQLINIVKGDMSFVGPRPLLVRYLDRYSDEQKRRHEVKPGITGWAQVNGRNAISWQKKFELDVWYVDNRSLKLDLTILYKTVQKVFKQEGISSDTSATMEEFMGN